MTVYIASESTPDGGRFIVSVHSSPLTAKKALTAHKETDEYDGGPLEITPFEVKP